ncbi:2'-deoxycytidine 5'-triphosphate deaminase domain-containing protein [Streptomyces sp. NPDC057638]|uniref:dCTP deaminase n=1 Tax=Streptomyces sp. NPDC057638 TaxID=3346190 RepID=UPI003699944F
MILTGPAIEQAVADGEIVLDPFDAAQVNPNSYNYRLGPVLRIFRDQVADPRREAATTEVQLPEDGYVLEPGRVHLGTTAERIGSTRFVPSLIGRSSLGRLGCFLQVSADLGQLGAVHHWTLEIVAVQPLRIYPGMRIGQVSFWAPTGAMLPYTGHYGTLDSPSPWHPGAVRGAGALLAEGVGV